MNLKSRDIDGAAEEGESPIDLSIRENNQNGKQNITTPKTFEKQLFSTVLFFSTLYLFF